MNKWISVKDELPPIETHIILYNGDVIFGLYSDDWHGKNYFTTNFEQFLGVEDVTHWMPLPEPPNEQRI